MASEVQDPKTTKILNCAIIKGTEKLKEAMVGIQVELMGGHQYPPVSHALEIDHRGISNVVHVYSGARLLGRGSGSGK